MHCDGSDCTIAENCPYGCSDGKCNDTPATCGDAGSHQCNEAADAVMICGNDGTWTKEQDCPDGCDKDKNECMNSCQESTQKCSDDKTKLLKCENSTWIEAEDCPNGCNDAQNQCNTTECSTVNETSCSSDKLLTCQDNLTWKETTCEFGCYQSQDNIHKCKPDCSTAGDVRCQGDAVETCSSEFSWEITTEVCPNGCNDGICKACTIVDETSCNEAGNVQTCQNDYTLKETEVCGNGCFENHCKACTEIGQETCSPDGNIQICQDDYTLKQTKSCAFGCLNDVCNECSNTTDCSTAPGWDEGTCTNGKCEATKCAKGYTLVNDTCSIEIPFEGNVFVTDMDGASHADIIANATKIIAQSGRTIRSWKNAKDTLSFFFNPKKSGSMKLFVKASLPDGTTSNTLTFTYGGISKSIHINSTDEQIYDVGTWDITTEGYIQIDMNGTEVSPDNSEFARISNFYIAGDVASTNPPACTTTSAIGDAYWHSRGPSVHLNYTFPSGSAEWFYNEVTVPKNNDVIGSYFMLTGFSEGYMGIQCTSGGIKKVLFSVWSGYNTDDPNQIPAEYQVTTLRKGKDVLVQTFGNEGSGMQSFLDYDWKTDVTYKTLVHISPNRDNTTDYTGYFCDETGTWHLLASFKRPKITTWYTGAHSFLENFIPESSIYTREVHFKNQWVRMSDGTWNEVTKAKFTCDNTGIGGYRTDMEGFMDGQDFVLKNCGHDNVTTEYGTIFDRSASGQNPPEIDINMLANLGKN